MGVSFLDYDKISDTIMYFTKEIYLNFCINLTRKNNNTGRISHFHNEYGYNNDYLGKDSRIIKRFIDAYFVINDSNDFKNNIIIRPKDIVMLRLLFNDMVLPWFIGSKRVFKLDNIGKLVLKGKYGVAEFPLSDYKFMSFKPIVIDYEDETTKEGIRICFNSNDNYIDINIDKFLEFYYFIQYTDIYNAAISLMNYIKTQPYGENYYDMIRETGGSNHYKADDFEDKEYNGKKKSNFFDKK